MIFSLLFLPGESFPGSRDSKIRPPGESCAVLAPKRILSAVFIFFHCSPSHPRAVSCLTSGLLLWWPCLVDRDPLVSSVFPLLGFPPLGAPLAWMEDFEDIGGFIRWRRHLGDNNVLAFGARRRRRRRSRRSTRATKPGSTTLRRRNRRGRLVSSSQEARRVSDSRWQERTSR